MKSSIPQNIRKLRQWKGYSQQKMADKLSISQAAYCDLESGQTKVSDEKLSKIAEALGVSTDIIENLNDSVIFNYNQSAGINSGLYSTYNIDSAEELKILNDELITSLKAQIENLKLIIESKDALIEALKKQ